MHSAFRSPATARRRSTSRFAARRAAPCTSNGSTTTSASNRCSSTALRGRARDSLRRIAPARVSGSNSATPTPRGSGFEPPSPMSTHFIDPRSVKRKAPPGLDVASLESALRRAVEGEVRFDDGSRALYATDASNYRQVPIGVVIPRTIEDVVRTVAACREHGAPVLSRGGGTSLCGQCCNVAVVIDFTKHLHRIEELDPQGRFARVQPGVVLDDLRNAAERHHLTFGPDPSTHDHNTLGGMIGNNS